MAPVRLEEVPMRTRLAAVRRLCREQNTPTRERLSLLGAAVAPSNKTYWVPKDMLEAVKGVANA